MHEKFWLSLLSPNLMGGNVQGIADKAYDFICGQLKKNINDPIAMIGYSRGGHIVIMVAQKLKNEGCPCGVAGKNHPVGFMGLYDAVDRARSGNTQVIPNNVEYVYHGPRHPGVHSRTYFGNTGTSGGQHYYQVYFWGDHAAMGGDPYNGDKVEPQPGWTVSIADNVQASKDINEWIRWHAWLTGWIWI